MENYVTTRNTLPPSPLHITDDMKNVLPQLTLSQVFYAFSKIKRTAVGPDLIRYGRKLTLTHYPKLIFLSIAQTSEVLTSLQLLQECLSELYIKSLTRTTWVRLMNKTCFMAQRTVRRQNLMGNGQRKSDK